VTSRQRLNVYRSVWLYHLDCIRGWVHVPFVLHSVIHVAVMSPSKMIPNCSLICPYHMLIIIVLCSRLPYSCLLLRICNACANAWLFVFVDRLCSWCLTVISLSVCPTYNLLHVLHCSLYIPLEIACSVAFCLIIAYIHMVLIVRKAMFM
jgi:hypothetical protein